MDEEVSARLALNRIAGIGPAIYSDLLECLDTASAVFNASRQQLSRVPALTPAIIDQIKLGIAATNVEQDQKWLQEHPQHSVLFSTDADYPVMLSEISRPPPVLFLKGDPSLLSTPQLAIIGSRNPTPGGIESAGAFAENLAACGLTITSGLASGIDGAAHEGALTATSTTVSQGRTIAVTATGLDRIYPSRHRDLAHRIADKGLLVSEFPIGTSPLRENFPRRNRLISGLSLGTLVVEAALRSGSLITARYAMEQGREVFAIPGSIHSPQSRGCHWLIKQGAKLVETAEDIAEEILQMLPANTEVSEIQQNINKKEISIQPAPSAAEQLLLDAMGFDPVTLDALHSRTGMAIAELSVNLSRLELSGMLDVLPGGRYSRRR